MGSFGLTTPSNASTVVEQFRSDFPEFSDTSSYSNALITTWFTAAAAQFTNSLRWGNLLQMAQELATAHYVTLAVRDLALNVPGKVQGLSSAESVDSVSASYDVQTVSFAEAGFWNSTSYGLRLYQLMRLVGAGGLQIHTGD